MKPTVKSLNDLLATINRPGEFEFEVIPYSAFHGKNGKSRISYCLSFKYNSDSETCYGFSLFVSFNMSQLASAVFAIVRLSNVFTHFSSKVDKVDEKCFDDDLPF